MLAEKNYGCFGAILMNYRQVEETTSILSVGRLQMGIGERKELPPIGWMWNSMAQSLKMRLGQITSKQTNHANLMNFIF